MPDPTPKKKRSDRRDDPASLAQLTMDQAPDAIFAIKPEDVMTVLASKSAKGRKGPAK